MALEELILASKHLGTQEKFLVYLPERYSPLYSYPVLYVQDGQDYLSMGRLATLLEEMHQAKEIPDLIAVFLPVDKSLRYDRYHPDGGQHQAYLRFLADEVVGAIDSRYSTHPLGSARTLLGESLGGVVSLFTALSYPHTFGQVACQSAAMDDELNRRVREIDLTVPLHIYLEVGLEETAVDTKRGPLNLLQSNESLRDILQTKTVTLAYKTFAGDHTWGYWQANLRRILLGLFG
ncbi:alpha/beta hydrolase-fold protein [Brevibacillus ruminantium]|uniref:Alpha/beta hydrolase-fold protein n=1 Tax=Brevibacillus ruminantium TaxID=2950604 RepID=A0ABY4WJQ0_9BACL|nr:alpha/beta hydrolase-fold protein [Brevibacillus ruminantium]USG67332.1 alpha/beta hydrolase-fold protein [Brevibacillus ruminantium]